MADLDLMVSQIEDLEDRVAALEEETGPEDGRTVAAQIWQALHLWWMGPLVLMLTGAALGWGAGDVASILYADTSAP